ncbi:hypothetical protein [Nocardioides terrisoli]|uniref:hypothetical protein n=1 Tax=Nocardioides terrisoli TaxID=3388267 RepID=UPI00287BB095|nr:hypothetical protein [Nocardioides marmorisolisilvae]
MTNNQDPRADRPATPYRLLDASDRHWVADLIETMRRGDVESTLADLDALSDRLRRAAKARRILATIDPELLRLGLKVGSREDRR